VWLLLIMGFGMAFGITWFTIPSIVTISRLKNLCNSPNGRTSHLYETPTLGGIAVFVAFILATVIFAGAYFRFELKYIITGLIIVFFLGIKDDILVIAPMKKLAGQIFAAGLIAVLADIRITSLYGLFGIMQLNYVVSVLLTVFVFIVIINGFNLIDGIDGLAAGVGILTTLVFGFWFWIAGNTGYTILCCSFAGTLAAFFYFNVFGKENKIFLGDTGSLVIGFVMSILVCRFLQFEQMVQGLADVDSTPTVACGILVIPLFDSLRVFFLRVTKGKSPFRADRQHIHHNLLKLGFTHLEATLILLSVNLFFIVLSLALQHLGVIWLMAVIVVTASLMSYMLDATIKKRREERFRTVMSSFFASKTMKDRSSVTILPP
jgi:UDP-GlcNAc:undecaprenyl-phosphate GlcNAc-1-phosphate transferase